jgi:hypothetical protein
VGAEEDTDAVVAKLKGFCETVQVPVVKAFNVVHGVTQSAKGAG